MNPDFGTIIWDMIFEPYTMGVKDAIAADIKKIVSYDPRLNIVGIDVNEQTFGIVIELTLEYIPTNQVDTLRLKFERESIRQIL